MKGSVNVSPKKQAETPAPPGAYDFDLFVLGGGSGGCAAALEAARPG